MCAERGPTSSSLVLPIRLPTLKGFPRHSCHPNIKAAYTRHVIKNAHIGQHRPARLDGAHIGRGSANLNDDRVPHGNVT